MPVLFFVILIIIIALAFSFFNGANDCANIIATTCATKALSPVKALIIVVIFDILGAFASTKVAQTIGKGIISSQGMTLTILLTGTLGAVIWVFFCTRVGIPISVSHALIGGLLGAGIVAGGKEIIQWGVLAKKVLLGIALGPAVGFLAGAFLLAVISWILYLFFKRLSSQKANKFFRIGQIFTTPFIAFTHGMNDAQNAMGVITAALLAGGFIETFYVSFWVKIACGLAMGIGTLLMGWRVVKTLGWKLTKIEPKEGFSAQIGAGIAVGLHSLAGMPISTTHVVCSSVIGGTALQNLKRIKQVVAVKMIIAWIITIPSAALFSAATYLIFSLFI